MNISICLQKIGFDAAGNGPQQVCCVVRARESCFGIVSVLGCAAVVWRMDLGCRVGGTFSRGIPNRVVLVSLFVSCVCIFS